MKKKWTVFTLIILLLQHFIPIVAVAETIKAARNELNITDIVVKNPQSVQPENVDMTIIGKVKNEDSYMTTIVMDSKVNLTSPEGNIMNGENQPVGTYQVDQSSIKLFFKEKVAGEFLLNLTGQLIDKKTKEQTISVVSENEKRETSFKLKETEEKIEENKNEEKKENVLQGKSEFGNRDNIDITELFEELGNGTMFFKTLTINGKSPGESLGEHLPGDPLEIALDFEIPEEIRIQMQAGDFIEIDINSSIQFDQEISFDLSDGELVYGRGVLSVDGKLRIEFTDVVTQVSNIKGEVHLSGQLARDDNKGPGETELEFPFVEEAPSFPIEIKPNTSTSISKNGHPDRSINPNKLIWNVDINHGMNKLTNATVKEKFPKGTKYESVKIYKMKVDFDGKILEGQGEVVDEADYTVSQDGTITFKNEIKDAYRIEYTTSILEDSKPGAEGGYITYQNEATLNADEMEREIPATGSITAQYHKVLEKLYPSYDKNNQTFTWLIHYNYTEFSIDKNEARLTDSFEGIMSLIDDSVNLMKVEFDERGYPIKHTKLDENFDYTIINKGDSFEIQFLHDIDYAVDIQYTTKIDEEVTGQQQYKNIVVDGKGHESGTQGNAEQQGLLKKLAGVDYGAKMVDWEIQVNNNRYDLINWEMEDTLSIGLTLPLNGRKFIVRDLNRSADTGYYVLEKEKDYTFSYDEAARKIKVKFIGEYAETNHKFIITYTTSFDTAILNEAGEQIFYNYADAKWKSKEGEDKQITDFDQFYPKTEEGTDGFKYGYYNAKSKKIEWKLGINYDKQPLGKVTITDPLLSNQKYVSHSLKIYKYRINKDGSYDQMELISGEEFDKFHIIEPTKLLNVLTITIDDVGPNDQYAFVFETSLEGQVVHDDETYHNKATVHASNVTEDFIIEGDVSIANGGKHISKKGEQDSKGFLNWEATINPSQSTVYEPVITDTPTPNQIIVEDSIELYETIVHTDGRLEQGKKLELNKDYKVNLVTDKETGQQKLTVSFIQKKIERAYILKYRASLMLEKPSGEIASNQIKLEGKNIEIVEDESGQDINVHVSDGGGSAVGVKGSVTIQKVDEKGKALTGAKFELWNKEHNAIVRKGEVDENGLLKLGPVAYGDYYLVETKAPKGHTISDELIGTGRPVKVTKETSNQSVLEKVINEKNKVKVLKQNSEGAALAGAEFTLYDENKISIKDPKGQPVIAITNEEGIAEFVGLEPGNYYVQESKAPIKPKEYQRNSDFIPFEVVKNGDDQIPTVDVGPIINYLGKASFVKKNQDETKLAGAQFKIKRIKDGAGNTIDESIQTLYTSDEQGKVTFDRLSPGEYKITEVKAPAGYFVNPQTMTFKIDKMGNEEKEITIENGVFRNYQASVVLEKEDEQGNKLEGAEFELLDMTNNVVKTNLKSDATGKIIIDEIGPGEYQLIETKAPAGFILNTTPYKIKIADKEMSESEVIKLTTPFVNYKGSAKMKKVDSKHNPLQGAEFTLYLASDIYNSTPLGNPIVSKKDGMLEMNNLSPGKYKLVETAAPLMPDNMPYVKSKYPRYFSIESSKEGKPTVVDLGEFQNFKGIVNVLKISGEKDETKGKPLEGAEFTLYQLVNGEEKIISEAIVSQGDGSLAIRDGGGELTSLQLDPGEYKLIETKAPAGFVVNSNPIFITVEDTNTYGDKTEVYEFENYKGSVRFEKINESGGSLTGAVFKLSKESSSGLKEVIEENWTGDSNGKFELSGLGAGSYVLEEIKAPKGYILDKRVYKFELEEYQGTPTVMELSPFENVQGKVSLKKVDESGDVLKGAEFELFDESGNSKGKKTTGEDGIILFENLAPGTYQLEEIKAPTGFIKQEVDKKSESNPLRFTIPAAIDEQNNQTEFELADFVNYQGEVLLTKTDELGKPLAGAVFMLWDTATNLPVKDEFGKDLLLTSDDSGKIVIQGLTPGAYELEEIEAPTGFIRTTERRKFVVKESVIGKPQIIDLKTFVNYKKKLEVLKKNEKGGNLVGAEFTLYDDKGQVVLDEAMKPVIAVSDKNGIATFSNVSPSKYVVKETKAPAGYVLNPVEMLVTVKESEEKPQIVQEVGTVVNYQGSVEVTKVDKDNSKKVLKNAEFALEDSRGKRIKDKLVTNERGQFTIDGLEPGNYFVVETKAPKGYILSVKKNEFVIKQENNGKPEKVRLTIFNSEKPNKPVVPTKPNKSKNDKEKLPQTGEITNFFYLICGILFIIMSGRMYQLNKRKE